MLSWGLSTGCPRGQLHLGRLFHPSDDEEIQAEAHDREGEREGGTGVHTDPQPRAPSGAKGEDKVSYGQTGLPFPSF